MRVLQIINRMMRGGGAEKFVLDLVVALSKVKDVEVEVLSISTPLNDDYIEILETYDIKHSILSKKLHSFINLKTLKNFIENRHYDIVHVHLFPALYYAAFIPNWDSKCKLIYTEHSTTNRRRKPFFKIIETFIYKKYSSIFAISDKVKEKLQNHVQLKNVNIINNGINIQNIITTNPTDIKETLCLPESTVIITMVARVNHIKDYNTVIRAIERLPSNYHAVFIGNGPLMSNLIEDRNSSSSLNRIHILGLRKDVIGIMKSSDVIVLSSKYEGFSIAMLEAMACHKPFVASRVPGIEDLVDGIAELFEFKNSANLAYIIENLINNQHYYNEIADRCFNFAKQYDINLIAKQYLTGYNELF